MGKQTTLFLGFGSLVVLARMDLSKQHGGFVQSIEKIDYLPVMLANLLLYGKWN